MRSLSARRVEFGGHQAARASSLRLMASAESVRSLKEAKVGRPLSAAFYFTGIGGGVRFVNHGMLPGPAAEVRLEGKSVFLAPRNVPLWNLQRQWLERCPRCSVGTRANRIARRVGRNRGA